MVYLTLVDGPNPKISIQHDATVVIVDTATEAAEWLRFNRIEEWLKSSSMDFSDEFGWPTASAGDDIIDAMWKLENR
jgi:hypothetical protein